MSQSFRCRSTFAINKILISFKDFAYKFYFYSGFPHFKGWVLIILINLPIPGACIHSFLGVLPAVTDKAGWVFCTVFLLLFTTPFRHHTFKFFYFGWIPIHPVHLDKHLSKEMFHNIQYVPFPMTFNKSPFPWQSTSPFSHDIQVSFPMTFNMSLFPWHSPSSFSHDIQQVPFPMTVNKSYFPWQSTSPFSMTINKSPFPWQSTSPFFNDIQVSFPMTFNKFLFPSHSTCPFPLTFNMSLFPSHSSSSFSDDIRWVPFSITFNKSHFPWLPISSHFHDIAHIFSMTYIPHLIQESPVCSSSSFPLHPQLPSIEVCVMSAWHTGILDNSMGLWHSCQTPQPWTLVHHA